LRIVDQNRAIFAFEDKKAARDSAQNANLVDQGRNVIQALRATQYADRDIDGCAQLLCERHVISFHHAVPVNGIEHDLSSTGSLHGLRKLDRANARFPRAVMRVDVIFAAQRTLPDVNNDHS
jgi:hypothetical protein